MTAPSKIPDSPKLILVADDDPDTRAIVADTISLMGHHTIEAADGREALKVYHERHPDLVLLDLMMPHLSGNEVCRMIRTSEKELRTPVLILTARDGIDDKVQSLEGGADDYLTKPFQFRELQARVQALLRVGELMKLLHLKHQELIELQGKLIEKERQLVATQLAGTAAHELGQPLTAILLNSGMLRELRPEDPNFQKLIEAITRDSKRMAQLIEELQRVNAQSTAPYHGDTRILEIEKDS